MAKIKRTKIQNAKIKLSENFPIYGIEVETAQVEWYPGSKQVGDKY